MMQQRVFNSPPGRATSADPVRPRAGATQLAPAAGPIRDRRPDHGPSRHDA